MRRRDTTLDGPAESHMKILDAIRRVPRGRVATYGTIADAAGLPGRARLVGFVLRTCPLADRVPWFRIVNASGRISERSGSGSVLQRRRLEREGVEIDMLDRINLAKYLWNFGSSAT